jgi:hypothetical protein
MRGRRIIQRGGPAPQCDGTGHAAGSCGNEPHGDRPGGFFLRRRREAGFRRCPSAPFERVISVFPKGLIKNPLNDAGAETQRFADPGEFRDLR